MTSQIFRTVVFTRLSLSCPEGSLSFRALGLGLNACLSNIQSPGAADVAGPKDHIVGTLRNSWPGPGSHGLLIIIQSKDFVASLKLLPSGAGDMSGPAPYQWETGPGTVHGHHSCNNPR